MNQTQIRQVCGNSAFQRGRNYFQSGKVLEAETVGSEEGYRIVSQVRGSGGRVYKQLIEITGIPDERLDFDGNCSCYMSYNCKHVAAVMFRVLAAGVLEQPKRVVNPIEFWLDGLAEASRPQSKEPAKASEPATFSLLYILVPDAGVDRGIQVLSQKVRLLKRGGYGKPMSYPLEPIRRAYGDNFIRPVDKEIAQMLASGDGYYYYDNSNNYQLQGELGELALRKMLASGRCHWQDKDEQPLSLGGPRRIEFHWENSDEGKRLGYRIEPAVKDLRRLDRLWYVDADRANVGVLEHPALSSEQALALLDAPPVPRAKLEEVSRRLLMDLPEYDLPTPVKLDIKQVRITGEPPRFQLHLHSREGNPSLMDGARYHCAQLKFAYGPMVLEDLPERNVTRCSEGETIYTVERDLPTETQARDEITARGLHLLDQKTADGSAILNWIAPGQTVAHSAMLWHQFMEIDVPQLQEQGWQVLIDDSFQLRFEEAEEWHAELEEDGSDWFSLTLGVELDGQRVNLLPTLVTFLSQAGDPQRLRELLEAQAHFLVPVGEHRWLKLPPERLRPIFDTLVELYDHEPLGEDGSLALSRHQGIQIGDLLNDPGLKWRGADELLQLNQRLRDFEGIEPVSPPTGFNAELRPYQQQGLHWLQFMREFEFNGILADDMGLGKTVQTLAHLLLEKHSGRMQQPSLVIAPTSLMGNWRRETERFAPDLKVLVLHGADRHDHFDQISGHDIILTTYPLLRRDQKPLLEHCFHYIILDESQSIKNPKSQTAQVVYQLKCGYRLCLTGTPMENHLGELWSMYHFLMPGFLGNLERFNRLFRNPIERHGDDIRQDQLTRRIKPFLLRRTKSEVAAELPEKTEIIRTVTLQGKQRDLYETIRLAMDKKVRAEIAKKGVARSQIMILDALLKLRQVCCDPRTVSLPQAKKVTQSAKLELLMEMLPEMVEEGRKILLFSQFTRMLGLIEMELQSRDIDYSKLTGQTRKRDEVITRFQNGEVPVFLISLKAGGVGLNLTAADTVIHYDPWWNPAVENQATDRAHRIGQDKAVFVYKLVTEETVEEKIIELQRKKQALADAIYSGKGAQKANALSADELTVLLKPLE